MSSRGADVAAIGDSQTYGYGVSSSESWPVVLADKTGRDVYNYGVPGYSPYQYHYLVKQAIDDGAKYVVVALLLQLDIGSDLRIPCDDEATKPLPDDFTATRHYQELNKLVDNSYETLCSEYKKTSVAFWKDLKKAFKTKIAITSAAYWLVYREIWTPFSLFEKNGDQITYRTRIDQSKGSRDRAASRIARRTTSDLDMAQRSARCSNARTVATSSE